MSETGEVKDEFADVPQGRPSGIRVGGDAAREEIDCQSCGGAGSYVIEIFGEPDENGVRPVERPSIVCAACQGRGKETVWAK